MRIQTTGRARLLRGCAVGVVLTGLFASSVAAATTQVSVNDSRTFSPARLTQAVGGSVHWAATGTDDHSVTQDRGLFNSGAPRAGVDLTRTFSAGTFPYHCNKHAAQGMRGVVSVPPQLLAAPVGLSFTVKWASSTSRTGNRFDVQYRIGSGAWQVWKGNTAARSAVFGAQSRPLRVARAKTYSFRVVSRLSATAKSGISPVKSFRAR